MNAFFKRSDMPTTLPEGLLISAYLSREDPRDVLISNGIILDELPRGATLGTASLRREAQDRRLRPDIDVGPLRGNVHSRLRKVDCGEIDATILGLAGLKRLGLAASAMQALSTDDFLPAVGQGAVAIETRDDEKTRELLAAIDHAPTAIAVTAERAFLSVLDGPCRTPIASYAVALGGDIEFRGVVLSPDGTKAFETRRSQPVSYATILCADAGAELKGRASARLIIQAG